MGEDQAKNGSELQRQMDELRQRVAVNRADIDSLQTRADANHLRIDKLEERADVDERLIAELQADGLVSAQHAAQMEEALRSSRKIGVAIGIIMARRSIDEVEAFRVLVAASQSSNRKLRVIAHEVVETGDVSRLPTV